MDDFKKKRDEENNNNMFENLFRNDDTVKLGGNIMWDNDLFDKRRENLFEQFDKAMNNTTNDNIKDIFDVMMNNLINKQFKAVNEDYPHMTATLMLIRNLICKRIIIVESLGLFKAKEVESDSNMQSLSESADRLYSVQRAVQLAQDLTKLVNLINEEYKTIGCKNESHKTKS